MSDPNPTDAVILVGGKGTRLRPLTLSAPKPMLPTAGLPFLTHLLARIEAAGIKHVVLGTSFKAEVFEDYFGDGSKMGLEIDYVFETEPLGTGGGIRNVLPKLRGDNVMVFNGDVLGGTDLNAILETHEKTDADVTLHLVRVGDPRALCRSALFLVRDLECGEHVVTRSGNRPDRKLRLRQWGRQYEHYHNLGLALESEVQCTC